MRRRTPATIGAAVVAAGLAASGCGSSSPEGALAGKTATQIVSLAVKALHRERSFHFVSQTKDGSQTQTQIGDVSKLAAVESITADKKPVVDAELVGQVVYLQAGTDVLERTLGLPTTAAATHAGDWISVSKKDDVYADVASSLSATSAIELFVPEEPHLKVDGATTLHGQHVVAVSGTSTASPSTDATGKVTLFVSTTAPYLPVGATLVVTSGNDTVVEQDAALFGRWGEAVHAKAPSGALPLSSLTADG